MKNLLKLFLTLFLITSCTENPEPEGVFIRIENSSELNLSDVLVNSGFGDVEFGDIKTGKKSGYNEFESAYRFSYVHAIADGKEFTIQPRDYVGETPLEKGYYTYKIGIDTSDPGNPNLTFALVIDN